MVGDVSVEGFLTRLVLSRRLVVLGGHVPDLSVKLVTELFRFLSHILELLHISFKVVVHIKLLVHCDQSLGKVFYGKISLFEVNGDIDLLALVEEIVSK